MQCYSSKSNEFGPVFYAHWSGSNAAGAVRRLAKRMQTRGDDLNYSSARLAQEMIGEDDGNLSFGMWNADKLLTAIDSHGDAGVVLIDVADGHKCKCLGGYLKVGADGFPT